MADAKKVDVPLLDLKAQYQTIKPAILEAINEVCDSQYFVMGPKVQDLEEQVAAYSQCKHAIGVSSGTDALLVALMALDIGRGDAVITTPYTFFATGGTIARLGARPVFCDIDARTFNLCPDALATLIERDCHSDDNGLVYTPSGDRIKTLMPVHLYGQTSDLDPLMDLAGKYGLSVIEDAAQSIGSEFSDGRRAGSVGDIGCFSFFPSKNLGAFGDGGMCTTNDDVLAEKMKILRLHGGKPKYYHSVIGGNFRLDALQAAILLVKLPYLDGWTAGRQKNANYYDNAFASAGLDERVTRPQLRTGRRHIYNQYVLRVPERDKLRQFLQDASIGTEIYYPVALHLQKCFASLGYSEGDCPVSEQCASDSIALPIYPELGEAQMAWVVDRLAAFYS